LPAKLQEKNDKVKGFNFGGRSSVTDFNQQKTGKSMELQKLKK